ncbi:MAG: hypothetical protein FWD64_06435 [Acidobacteriaceae bacterium]|nr:hypothetical protein [Acidobacteriaceae bacterium]
MLKPISTLALAAAIAALFALTGCKHNSAAAATASPTLASAERAAIETARQQLDLIPPPSKERYTAVSSLDSWENPYLTVQGNMVTLHVLVADANPSALGQGGLLRPLGARRRNVDVRITDLPAALNAIPASAWPYGRVVAVEEAHDAPAAERHHVRRNVETVIKMLSDLGIVVYEWSTTGGSQG